MKRAMCSALHPMRASRSVLLLILATGGQLDGHVIEQCVNAGDGLFKEGAWVKISEEYQNHPERQQLGKFVGKFGRLTRRYHGRVSMFRCSAVLSPVTVSFVCALQISPRRVRP